jgi:tRNA-dihydrouridine synthase
MKTLFLLAPMAELSHRPLRELIEGFGGCDEYFTEMISAGAFVAGGPFEAWYADGGPRPEKIVYQIAGSDASQIAKAAALLSERDCLGIDINMGCSAPAITRSGAGVRWMEDIDKAGNLIALVRKGVKRRLSVKLRTGPSDDFEYLVRFCRRLEEEGAELITLHPRTAKEKFRRTARWNYIPALKKELRIKVAGNGDISSAAEMLNRAALCDAVMTGRLAVRQPWCFSEARPPDKRNSGRHTVEETGLRFLELLAQYQPPEFHLSRARRFFSYFCDNLTWAHYVKTLLNREQHLAGIEQAWRRYFAEHPEEPKPAESQRNRPIPPGSS